MDPRASAAAIKAVAAEYIRRVTRPFLIGGLVAAIVLLSVILYLAQAVSLWWLILLLPLGLPILFLLVAFFIIKQLTTYLAPALTKDQRKSAAQFVDKLQRTSENLQTPPLIIAWRTIRTAQKGQENYLRHIVDDSSTLKDDFARTSQHFNK